MKPVNVGMMTKTMENVEQLLEMIEKEVANGNIKKITHPLRPHIAIYNYTQQCQFEKNWNPVTLACRGLIIDTNKKEILARPFKKFFNMEELSEKEIPYDKSFKVTEKMDGSLGILYFINNLPHFATRGSFNSDQAVFALEYFNKYRNPIYIDENFTYLFEIIYPENRIVVDYGKDHKLVLLAVIHTESGEERDVRDYRHMGFEIVKHYAAEDFNVLKAKNTPNKEGFVIRFDNGFRMKIKFEEYVRLHRILTNVSTKVIWSHMMEGKPLDEILQNVPDEFFTWVKKTMDDLREKFNKISEIIKNDFSRVQNQNPKDRKEFAELVKNNQYKHLLFSLLDRHTNKFELGIWKLIKPEFQKPFREDIDA